MIEILVFAGIPIVLLLLLSLLGATWKLEVDAPEEVSESYFKRTYTGHDSALCTQRIFSPEDQKFVNRLGSPRLEQIYRAERTRVALYWVHSVSSEVRQVMREHRVAAGTKRNLQVRREMALVFHYAEFRLLCGLLAFSIRVFGPHALGNVAVHVLRLSEGIGKVLQEASAAARIEPAGNLSGA